MRRLPVLLTAGLAVAVPVPATALGDVRVVLISPMLPHGPSVTCDTSAYPAASYPCSFALDVTQGCADVSAQGDNSCSLRVRGPLTAIPAFDSRGRCTFDDFVSGPFTVTYTGSGPAWEVSQGIEAVVQAAEVQYGAYGPDTPFTLLLTVHTLAGGVAGQIVAGFRFDDLMWDCRTRAGGDPSSMTADDNIVPAVTTGVLVVSR